MVAGVGELLERRLPFDPQHSLHYGSQLSCIGCEQDIMKRLSRIITLFGARCMQVSHPTCNPVDELVIHLQPPAVNALYIVDAVGGQRGPQEP